MVDLYSYTFNHGSELGISIIEIDFDKIPNQISKTSVNEIFKEPALSSGISIGDTVLSVNGKLLLLLLIVDICFFLEIRIYYSFFIIFIFNSYIYIYILYYRNSCCFSFSF